MYGSDRGHGWQVLHKYHVNTQRITHPCGADVCMYSKAKLPIHMQESISLSYVRELCDCMCVSFYLVFNLIWCQVCKGFEWQAKELK